MAGKAPQRWRTTTEASINFDHNEYDRWSRLWLVHAFCHAIRKGIQGEEREELYCHFREMSRATGAKKPSEIQKAKALLGKRNTRCFLG